MIIQNTSELDLEDSAVLFAAVVKFAEAIDFEGSPYDVSIARVGYAAMLERCTLAASVIAVHHKPEGDNWDGGVWRERLEDCAPESLAARLLIELDECEPDAEGVRAVTLDWLAGVA